MREIPQFVGMSCFEICHHDDCKDLFVNIQRGNSTYSRSLRNHPIRTLLTEIYKADLPRRSERTIIGRPRNTAQSCPNISSDADESIEEEPQRIASKRSVPNVTPRNVHKRRRQPSRTVLDRRRSSRRNK